jgi:ubiquinone/menaquinone biosynthesis C-methylase UbiE
MASHRNKDQHSNITWCHAQAEKANLPDESYDLITMIGTTHEFPLSVIPQLFG